MATPRRIPKFRDAWQLHRQAQRCRDRLPCALRPPTFRNRPDSRKAEDANTYAALAENVRTAWQAAYVTLGGSRIGDDKQDDYVRALAFDLLPPAHRAPAAARLAQLVETAGFHLGTGFLSTPMLLATLVEAGYTDTAYRVLQQTTTPSWLAQTARGATTMWETWEGYKPGGTPTASHNHYAFGSVASFLQEHVAGLSPAAPGYARLRVAPVLGGGLTSASVTIDTPYGRAASAWATDQDGVAKLKVTVPPGVTAHVLLGDIDTQVGSGNHRFTTAALKLPTAPQDTPRALP